MHPIYIPHLLNATDRTQRVSFEVSFDQLETLTPVRAALSVRHGTSFLEVKGQASTIVTLTCDRCLQRYNHRLSVDAQEIIWLTKRLGDNLSEPLEQELSAEELVESLSPDGHFEPDTWIYEQVCLEIPQRQICAPGCSGILVSEGSDNGQAPDPVDHRWSALAALKQQLALEDNSPGDHN